MKIKRKLSMMLLALLLAVVTTFVSAPQTIRVFADTVRNVSLSGKIADEEEVRLPSNSFDTKESDFDETEIIAEDITKRTENSKTFVQADGTYVMQVYNTPIHFLRDDEYHEIDNTIGTNLRNTANSFEVAFSPTGTGSLVSIADDVGMISMIPVFGGKEKNVAEVHAYDGNQQITEVKNARKTLNKTNSHIANGRTSVPKLTSNFFDNLNSLNIKNDKISNELQSSLAKTNSSIYYSDIYQDVDIQYALEGKSLKEYIIVHTPQDNYSFRFELNLNGYKANQIGGDIILSDMRGEPAYIIPKGNMRDAIGSYSDDVEYVLEESEGIYFLEVIAAQSFFEHAVFPVAIDPTIETFNSQYLRWGTYYTGGGSTNYRFTSGDSDRAFINLYENNPYLNKAASEHAVVRATLNVGFDWANQTGFKAVTKQYSNYDTLNSSSVLNNLKCSSGNVGDGNGTLQIDVTSYFGRRLDNLVVSIMEVNNIRTWYRYESSSLEIVFTQEKQTIVQDMGNNGVGVVDLLSGSVNYSYEDISIDDGFMPINVSHVFDESFGSGYYVGTNFRLNFHQRITYHQHYWTYVDAAGTTHYFSHQAGYNHMLGLRLVVKNDLIFLIDRAGNSMVFSNHGSLLEIHQYPSTYESKNNSATRKDALWLSIKYVNEPANRKDVNSYQIDTITNNKTTVKFNYASGLLDNISYTNGSGSHVEMTKYYYHEWGNMRWLNKIDKRLNESVATKTSTNLSYSAVGSSLLLGLIYDNSSDVLKYSYNSNGTVSEIETYIRDNWVMRPGSQNIITVQHFFEGGTQYVTQASTDTLITKTTVLSTKGKYYRHVSFSGQSVVSDYAYESVNGSLVPSVTLSNEFDYLSFINTYANTNTLVKDIPSTFYSGASISKRYSSPWGGTRYAHGRETYAVTVWVRTNGAGAYPSIEVIPYTTLDGIQTRGEKIVYWTNGALAGQQWQLATLILPNICNLTQIDVTIKGYNNTPVQVGHISVEMLPSSKPKVFAPEYDIYDRLVRTYHFNAQDNTITMLQRYYFPGTNSASEYPDLIESTVEFTVPANEVETSDEFKSHEKGSGNSWKNRTVYTYSNGSTGHLIGKKFFGLSSSENISESYTYFADGRLSSVTDANGVVTHVNSSSGRVASTVSGGGQAPNIDTTNYYQPGTGLLTSTSTGGVSTNFEYTNLGALSAIKRNDFYTNFKYNSDGSLASIGIGSNATTNTFNLAQYGYSNQQLTSITYGNNQTVNYKYDADNRLQKMHGANNSKIADFYYSTTDDTYVRTENAANVTYTNYSNYAHINNVYTAVNDGKKMDVHDAFADDAGNLTSSYFYYNGSPIETQIRTHNPNGTLKSLTRDMVSTTSYEYGDHHQLSKKQTAFGSSTLKHVYEYKKNGTQNLDMLQKDTFTGASRSDVLEYGYYPNGMVQSYHNGSYLSTYTYDTVGRLSFEVDYNKRQHYVTNYNDAGNISEKLVYDLSWNPIASGTRKYEYDSIWKDRLTRYNGNPITYDNAGNPKNYMGKAMTWQNGNQLASVAGLNMQYDYAGMRTQKGSVRYFWQGSQLLAENNPNYGAFTYFYYDETGISGMKVNENNGLNYYFRKNIFGDVTDIYHSSGNWVGGYTYDAWGKTTIKPNSGWEAVVNPFRYRGYYQDEETGFYYISSRYYDPEIGRFINADDPRMLFTESLMPGGANLYAYCYNNPVMYSDPSGHGFFTAAMTVISIISLLTMTLSLTGDSPQAGYDNSLGQISGGAGSMANGGYAMHIGWQLRYFGIWGKIFGYGLMAIGGATMAWGATEVYNGATDSNFTWGMSPELYYGIGIGLNIASMAGSIAGTSYINSRFTSHGFAQARGRDGGLGVKYSAIQDTLRTQQGVWQPRHGTWGYHGTQSFVSVNAKGQIVTAWAKSRIWRLY